jgi:hypothetical protein
MPVPYARRTKGPTAKDWPARRFTEADIPREFSNDGNLGLLDGYGSLIDIDLDSPEALRLAPAFLPDTGLVHGRPSKRRSHRWYRCDPAPRTTAFDDPCGRGDGVKARLLEIRGLKADGRFGLQTMVPPSQHPDGESITWDAYGTPAVWDGDDLLTRAHRLAAAALLLRYCPGSGQRHEVVLALSGALARAGWTIAEAEAFIVPLMEAAGDEKARARPADIRDTFERQGAGIATTGLPRLTELVDEHVIRRVIEWLGLQVPPRPTEVPALPFRTARTLTEGTAEDTEWQVHGLLAKGAVTEIDGKIKVAGKTTFMLAMVRAKIDGLAFLGRTTSPGPVVILTEQSAQTFKVALRRAGLADREDVIVLGWRDTIGHPWPVVVKAATAECCIRKANTLIADTLGQFTGVLGDQENAAGRSLEALKPLQAAAADGLAVLVLRHERKSGGEVGEAGRGSSAYGGGVDIILSLRRAEGNHPGRPRLRELHGLSRFDETPDRLLIEWEGGANYVVHGAAADVERQETRKAILGVLPEAEEAAATAKELILATGRKMTQAVVYEILQVDVREERVGRKGTGKRGDPYRFWRLTDSSTPFFDEKAQEDDSGDTQYADQEDCFARENDQTVAEEPPDFSSGVADSTPRAIQDDALEVPPVSSATPAGVQEEIISLTPNAAPIDSSTTSNPKDSMFRKKRREGTAGGDGDPLRAEVFLLGREVGFRRTEYAPGLAILEGEAAWRKFAEVAAPDDLQLAVRSLLAQ